MKCTQNLSIHKCYSLNIFMQHWWHVSIETLSSTVKHLLGLTVNFTTNAYTCIGLYQQIKAHNCVLWIKVYVIGYYNGKNGEMVYLPYWACSWTELATCAVTYFPHRWDLSLLAWLPSGALCCDWVHSFHFVLLHRL